ncbi:SH3 domain-containing protein [Sulfitobacter brevis]|uniref:SH3 domain-containing protein n=1 Tax=Sulfitobacter brevis TaxID=74348 RepID=A0A1I1VRH6_9RHOB|nr:SH3 domain-containing protein [Sulfitobacter brevis]SFD85637.1 SH3 domain-containing protein [Sulfitobacter brevis]
MRKAIIPALLAFALVVLPDVNPAAAATRGDYEVGGVAEDNLLKMRAGPGTGYQVILGLPNGTALRVHKCTQTGGTRWCEVSLAQARAISGFVSWAYLRER